MRFTIRRSALSFNLSTRPKARRNTSYRVLARRTSSRGLILAYPRTASRPRREPSPHNAESAARQAAVACSSPRPRPATPAQATRHGRTWAPPFPPIYPPFVSARCPSFRDDDPCCRSAHPARDIRPAVSSRDDGHREKQTVAPVRRRCSPTCDRIDENAFRDRNPAAVPPAPGCRDTAPCRSEQTTRWPILVHCGTRPTPPARGNAQCVSHLGGDLLRPVLACIRLRILEQPVRLAIGASEPELRLAAHHLSFHHPVGLDLDDRVGRIGGTRHTKISPLIRRGRSCLRAVTLSRQQVDMPHDHVW